MLSPAALRKTEPLIRALQQIGAKHQASASQIALSWLVTFHGQTVVAIPGATKATQAAEIGRTLSLTLTSDELGQLDVLSHGMTTRLG